MTDGRTLADERAHLAGMERKAHPTGNAKRYATRELIRSALQHAILERESYIDAIAGCQMHETEQECRDLIAGWTRILACRYQQRTVSEAVAAQSGGLTSMAKIIDQPPQEFRADPLDLRLKGKP